MDERVPVLLGDAGQAGADDLVLALPPAGHAIGCACCVARDPLGVALAGAFVARARGQRAFFRRVLVLAPPTEAKRIAAALEADPVSRARFRYAGVLPAGETANPV